MCQWRKASFTGVNCIIYIYICKKIRALLIYSKLKKCSYLYRRIFYKLNSRWVYTCGCVIYVLNPVRMSHCVVQWTITQSRNNLLPFIVSLPHLATTHKLIISLRFYKKVCIHVYTLCHIYISYVLKSYFRFTKYRISNTYTKTCPHSIHIIRNTWRHRCKWLL